MIDIGLDSYELIVSLDKDARKANTQVHSTITDSYYTLYEGIDYMSTVPLKADIVFIFLEDTYRVGQRLITYMYGAGLDTSLHDIISCIARYESGEVPAMEPGEEVDR